MFGNLSRSGEFPANYTDDGLPFQNRKSTVIAVIASLLVWVLAWFCVGLRIYVRVHVVRKPGWDDVVVVLALLTGSTSAIGLCLITNYGLGHHFVEVPDSDRETFFQLFYISNASFSMSNAFVKLSVLLQYLRVFQDRMPRLRTTSLALIVVVALWGLAFSFMAWFPCFPPYQFYRLGSEEHCYGYGSTNPLEVYTIVVASNGSNMALDFLILALPVPLLFSQDTMRPTRLGLIGLFFIGALYEHKAASDASHLANSSFRINVIAASRIIANRATSDSAPDPTRTFPTIILLGETENRLSLVLASIPVFWPVVAKTWQTIIYVTREVKVESVRHLPELVESGPMNFRDALPELDWSTTLDETIEAGLRHPGRLWDVDRYMRELISPFAETETLELTRPGEIQRSFAEELEANHLDFETVPEIIQPKGPIANIARRDPPGE
ncbi:hypothetical protein CMUS01_05731 [Colletotrichum musicola]|uniref:Rhodopsin domain-containing protein n=1 Tax=Colletotrichum musicola TaxID=2175873 RepID=A0A8H6KPX4_9PEZI|nr:hypothetical protein CMUS01_05731 [Colletotrichum musicola]